MIWLGTGQAVAPGERGEGDVLLVHASDSETKYVDSGQGVVRKLVMHSDFVIVGPPLYFSSAPMTDAQLGVQGCATRRGTIDGWEGLPWTRSSAVAVGCSTPQPRVRRRAARSARTSAKP